MSLEKVVDPVFDEIIKKATLRGFNLQQYKTSFLKRRVDTRLRAKELGTYSQYLSLLDNDPSEYDALFRSVSINVTEFFGNKEVFLAFSNTIMPQLLNEKLQHGMIRIWSAGCATGEEAYSLSILLNEVLHTSTHEFRIYATDISVKAIEFAKQGKYSSLALKNIPKELLTKYFHPLSDDEYQISQEIKNSVLFNVGDLASFHINYLDAIFCRNVLIYHGKETHDSIFKKFHSSLKTSGYLILGMDESIRGEHMSMFNSLMPRQRIYQKR